MAESNVEVGRGVLLGPVAVVGLALVGLQFLVRLVIVPQSFWWEDDFIHLADARTKGLTGDFLVADYNDHVEIFPNFVSWLLTRLTDSSWAPAAVSILLLSMTASLTMFLLLRELFGPRPAILVPFAAYLFSPLFLVSVTWLAAGLQALPMHIALLGTGWAMLRLTRTGERRWLAVALALHVFGLLAWEKGALVLPFVFGLQVLVSDAGRPVRERIQALRRHWLGWLSHAALLGSYAVLYLNVVDGSERQDVHGADYLEAARTTMFRVLVPGLFGAPWSKGDAVNTIYPNPGTVLAIVCAVLLGLLVVVSIIRTGRAALGPWLLATAYVAVDVALMLWGRAGFLTLVARDPRYITDAVPVVLVCASAAFLGTRSAARAAWTWRSLVPAGAVAAVVAAGSLLTTFQLAPVLEHEYARTYVQGVLARSDPDPGTSVIDTAVPKLVSGNVDHRGLLWAMGRRVTLNQPSTRMLVFDDAARLVPVSIPLPVLVQKGPIADCGWPVDEDPQVIGTVPAGAEEGFVLQAGNLSGVAGTLTIRVGESEQSLTVGAGLALTYFYLPAPSGDIVASFDSEDGSGTCVTDLLLGRPGP
jgi:hypothetical protein